MNGHWQFDCKMDPEHNAGFVYAVIDNVMGLAYIGKKGYHSSAGGRLQQSNWRSYTTSSKTLKLLFEHRPLSEFSFICIEEYKYKSDLAYAESWSLFKVRALEQSAFWYNKGIESVSWSVRVPPTARHKERLAQVEKEIYGPDSKV